MRDVAEDGLEGEDDVDPLIPRVADLVTLFGPAAKKHHRFHRVNSRHTSRRSGPAILVHWAWLALSSPGIQSKIQN